VSYPDSFFNLPAVQKPARRVLPLAGIALLVLAVAAVALLFVPPLRVAGLGALLVFAAVLAVLWFYARQQTNQVLVLATVGVLVVGLGLGGALLVIDRSGTAAPEAAIPLRQAANQQDAPPDLAPAPGGFVGPSVAPGSAPTGVAPVPAPREPAKPVATHKPAATRTPAAPAAPAPRIAEPPSASVSPDPSTRAGADSTTDTDTPTPTEEDRGCKLGEYRINPDTSADVCTKSGTWHHSVPDEHGDYH
jgi:hypothetical protein